MTQIDPWGWREGAATGAAQRKIETLTLLEHALPDAYQDLRSGHGNRNLRLIACV